MDVVDLRAGRQLWSQTFTADREQPLDIQDKITADIARVFDSAMSARRGWGPTDPSAYGAFQDYLTYADGGRPEEALIALEEVLDLDPTWATGWRILAGLYLRLANFTHDSTAVEGARDAARRLRELDEAELASSIDAIIDGYLQGNLAALEASLRSRGDRQGYLYLMFNSGLYREVRDAHRGTTRRYSYNVGAWDHLAVSELALGNFSSALEASRRCAYLAPPRSYNCYMAQIAALPKVDLEAARTLLIEMQETQSKIDKDSLTYRLNDEWIGSLRYFIQVSGQGANEDMVRIACDDVLETNKSWQYINCAFRLSAIGQSGWREFYELAIDSKEFKRFSAGYFYAMSVHYQGDDVMSLDKWRDALGFTNEWRFYLCSKANLWPVESGIACNPDQFR